MRKPNGYTMAKVDPFPKGRIGVGVVRPDKKIDQHDRYSVCVFMPPMKGVTIDVPIAGGRVEIDTGGMIPVLSRVGFEWGQMKLLLMDREKNLAPFTIANVYNNGNVCWGPAGMPKSMSKGWEEFWTRPFNSDLTDIPSEGRDDDDEDFQAWYENADCADYEPELDRLLERVNARREKAQQAATLGVHNGRRTGVTTTTLIDAYNMEVALAGPTAPGATQRGTWIDDMRGRVTRFGSAIESRRRAVAAARGVSWMGAAAHDTTWRAYIRFREYLEARQYACSTGSWSGVVAGIIDATYNKMNGVRNIVRSYARDFGFHLCSKYADREGLGHFHRRQEYAEDLEHVKNAIEDAARAVDGIKPRWLRKVYRSWVKRWLYFIFWNYVRDSVQARLDDRMRAVYSEMEHDNCDDDSPRDRAIRNHFLGGDWVNTLEFTHPEHIIGSGFDKMEFPPVDKYDGVVLVPAAVVNAACADRPWRDMLWWDQTKNQPYLFPHMRLPNSLYMTTDSGSPRIEDRALAHRVFLGRRYKDTSVYLIEPIDHPGKLFLYDGRWRLLRVDELDVDEVERVATELDTTMFWGNIAPFDAVTNGDVCVHDLTDEQVQHLVEDSQFYSREEGQDLI